MTSSGWLSSNKHLCRIIDGMIVILVGLAVPYTHGYLQYFGLIIAAILLVALNHAIARNRKSTTGSV
jgi:hypothetical protein